MQSGEDSPIARITKDGDNAPKRAESIVISSTLSSKRYSGVRIDSEQGGWIVLDGLAVVSVVDSKMRGR